MPLGMEVGLGPGQIVLDGDPAPPTPKGAQPPIFGPCLLWPNGWMDQDATWHEGRLQPKPNCQKLDGDQAPPKKGTAPPTFQPMFIVTNGWMDQDATWYEGRLRPGQHYV